MKITKTTALLVAGLGAFAIYKFNQMSEEEKKALKDKGKKFFDDHVSPMIKGALGMTEDPELAAQQESLK